MKRTVKVLYPAVLVFTAFILYRNLTGTPLIWDDYENLDLLNHSFSGTYDMVKYVLNYGNGRYLGNLLVFILLDHPIFSTLFRLSAILLLAAGIALAFGLKKPEYYLLSLILVLSANPLMFGQVFVWTSGFANYVPPLIIHAFCIYFVKSSKGDPLIRSVLILILGISGTLFVEHTSVTACLFSYILLIYIYFSTDRRSKDPGHNFICAGVYALACSIGTFLMFCLPRLLGTDFSRVEKYRHIGTTDREELLSRPFNFFQLTSVTFSQNFILWILLGTGAFIIISKTAGRWKNPFLYQIARLIAGGSILIPFIIFILKDTNIAYLIFFRRIVMYVCPFAALLTYLLILAHIADLRIKINLLLILAAALCSIGPFLLIHPYGERCMFEAYILLGTGGLCMIHYGAQLPDAMDARQKERRIHISHTRQWACVMILLVVLILDIYQYREFDRVKTWDQERNTYIADCMDKGYNFITVPDVPSAYAFNTRCFLMMRYYYYEHRYDLYIYAVPYESWYERRQVDSRYESIEDMPVSLSEIDPSFNQDYIN